jgi:hypothetical protein
VGLSQRPVPVRSGSSADTSDRILTFSSFFKARPASCYSLPKNAKRRRNHSKLRGGSVSFILKTPRKAKRPKKDPLLQLAGSESKRLQNFRKHRFPQARRSPARHDPVPLVASRGQVLKVTSSIREAKGAIIAPWFCALFLTISRSKLRRGAAGTVSL